MTTPPQPSRPADVAGLTYEQARAELDAVVAGLERGNLPLDEVLTLWERGEALVAHCRAHLVRARERIEAATAAREPDASRPPGGSAGPDGAEPF